MTIKNINEEIRKYRGSNLHRDVVVYNKLLEVRDFIEESQTWGIAEKGFKAVKDEFAIFINKKEILGEAE